MNLLKQSHGLIIHNTLCLMWGNSMKTIVKINFKKTGIQFTFFTHRKSRLLKRYATFTL